MGLRELVYCHFLKYLSTVHYEIMSCSVFLLFECGESEYLPSRNYSDAYDDVRQSEVAGGC